MTRRIEAAPVREIGLRSAIGSLGRLGMACAHTLSGRGARERARLDGSCVAVLMYHRVLPRSEARRLMVEPGMFVTPQTFARHLDCLAERFHVLSLAEVVTRFEAGDPLPPRACAITFDDGWRDNLDHALPLLAARRMPATIFAVSDRIGTLGAYWPDEVVRRLSPLPSTRRAEWLRGTGLPVADGSIDAVLAGLKAMPERQREVALAEMRRTTDDPVGIERELLDWDELERLSAAGISIESHSASHAILTGVPPEEARTELRRSLETLRARGHARHRLLAYPSGDHDETVVELARAAGYRAAVTTRLGLATATDDPLRWPRVAIHDDISRTQIEFLRWVPGPAVAGISGAAAGGKDPVVA